MYHIIDTQDNMIDLNYLSLLRNIVNNLTNQYGDLSIVEFERLYKTDDVFRKNIQLEIKDMLLLTQKLYKQVNQR
ncbi:hypothetical protein A3A55_03325 [Candidatus Roizmanbacteria bacterium RIFCSPLOWO2_01_FULL_40_14]|nr:MAG: hypothetical protein A3A55_03325 [Candidatus Roizmanbacteria bacterium RIFCSPLOWO2_01_FULL_40_14]